jgi:hypothetical protein
MLPTLPIFRWPAEAFFSRGFHTSVTLVAAAPSIVDHRHVEHRRARLGLEFRPSLLRRPGIHAVSPVSA